MIKGIQVGKITNPKRCLQYCQERIAYGKDVGTWESLIKEINNHWFQKELINNKLLKLALRHYQKCIDRGESKSANEYLMNLARSRYANLNR